MLTKIKVNTLHGKKVVVKKVVVKKVVVKTMSLVREHQEMKGDMLFVRKPIPVI